MCCCRCCSTRISRREPRPLRRMDDVCDAECKKLHLPPPRSLFGGEAKSWDELKQQGKGPDDHRPRRIDGRRPARCRRRGARKDPEKSRQSRLPLGIRRRSAGQTSRRDRRAARGTSQRMTPTSTRSWATCCSPRSASPPCCERDPEQALHAGLRKIYQTALRAMEQTALARQAGPLETLFAKTSCLLGWNAQKTCRCPGGEQ